jgi:DNA-binding PadR family transcriptional regulator
MIRKSGMGSAKTIMLDQKAGARPLFNLIPSRSGDQPQAMEGEMRKGDLDMIVLAALASGPAHGYAVIQEIRRRNGGAFDLPEGAIYPALYRLEQGGLLNSRWTAAGSGRQRCVYSLTRSGRRALSDQRTSWRRFADAIVIVSLFADRNAA